MNIIKHRINFVKDLEKVSPKYGVEVDVRPYAKDLILEHEPYVAGELLENFLKHFRHKFIIFNIKSEGIELDVINLAEKYKISDYFLLDVSFPFIVKYTNRGFRKFAVRFSEYESIRTCLSLKNKVDWVFIDNFTRLPVEDFSRLNNHFKICIVSPELLGRDDITITKNLLTSYRVDAVLTKRPGEWET